MTTKDVSTNKEPMNKLSEETLQQDISEVDETIDLMTTALIGAENITDNQDDGETPPEGLVQYAALDDSDTQSDVSPDLQSPEEQNIIEGLDSEFSADDSENVDLLQSSLLDSQSINSMPFLDSSNEQNVSPDSVFVRLNQARQNIDSLLSTESEFSTEGAAGKKLVSSAAVDNKHDIIRVLQQSENKGKFSDEKPVTTQNSDPDITVEIDETKDATVVSNSEQILAALNNASAGDLILLEGGEYGDLNLTPAISAHLNGLSGSVTIKSINENDQAIFSKMDLDNGANLTLKNIGVDSAQDPVDEVEVKISNNNIIVIENNDELKAAYLEAQDGDILQLKYDADGYQLNSYNQGQFSETVIITSYDLDNPAYFEYVGLQGSTNITFDSLIFLETSDTSNNSIVTLKNSDNIRIINSQILGDADGIMGAEGYTTAKNGINLRGVEDFTLENTLLDSVKNGIL